MPKLRLYPVQIGLCFGNGEAWSQASDHGKPRGLAAASVRRIDWTRAPDVDLSDRKKKRSRHDTNNRVGLLPDAQVVVDDVRIRTEATFPETIADDDDPRSSESLLLRREASA